MFLFKNTKKNNDALLQAAFDGDHATVERLVSQKLVNLKTCGFTAMEAAALKGHAACVAVLAPVVDCTDFDSRPLRYAVGRKATANNIECVTILLPHSNLLGMHFKTPVYEEVITEALKQKYPDATLTQIFSSIGGQLPMIAFIGQVTGRLGDQWERTLALAEPHIDFSNWNRFSTFVQNALLHSTKNSVDGDVRFQKVFDLLHQHHPDKALAWLQQNRFTEWGQHPLVEACLQQHTLQQAIDGANSASPKRRKM